MGEIMHDIRWSTILFSMLCTLFLSSCSEYLPVSSGALSGTATETPAQWTDVAPVEIIQLETGGDDAYSVNLWVVELAGDLYVCAGDNRATWVENIEMNTNVRLRANELIYSLRATRITDAATFEVFAQAWEAKYGNRPRNESVDETYLFRLDRQ